MQDIIRKSKTFGFERNLKNILIKQGIYAIIGNILMN
jgi:hypothetical protein